jgi:ABC-type branched-subunit amino acid transport system substrate-binding protein
MTGRMAALLMLLAAVATAGELTPAQQRGKHLYLTGQSVEKRPVTALLGADDVEIEASIVPCANCHGRDGSGRAEGGIRPANLQWDVLIHSATAGEITREPYTRSLLKRAVAMGIDSSARALNNTMPRYRMSMDDMEDLLAYLEKLGSDDEPGVTDDAVRIGVVLPPVENEQRAIRKTLEVYFERLNAGGGIFGRHVDARFTSSSGTPEQRAQELERFIQDEQPFAIGASSLTGADLAMSAVAERAHVPTIAAFSVEAPPQDRCVFRLLAGVREQGLALVAAAKALPTARITLLVDEADMAVPSAIRTDLAAAGHMNVEIATTITGHPELVLFLAAPARLQSILHLAAAIPSPPRVLVPAAHSGGDLTDAPLALDGRILIAIPSSPDDVNDAGEAELHALAVPPAHATACRLALASVKLLVEALRRSGRDLDRQALVSTLETFYRTPTDLTPPITWAPNQHTGTREVRVAALDLKKKRWVDLGHWSGPL